MILYFRDQDIRADALKEGREMGSDQTRRQIVRAMLANGVDREVLCRSASITEAELEEILQEGLVE